MMMSAHSSARQTRRLDSDLLLRGNGLDCATFSGKAADAQATCKAAAAGSHPTEDGLIKAWPSAPNSCSSPTRSVSRIPLPPKEAAAPLPAPCTPTRIPRPSPFSPPKASLPSSAAKALLTPAPAPSTATLAWAAAVPLSPNKQQAAAPTLAGSAYTLKAQQSPPPLPPCSSSSLSRTTSPDWDAYDSQLGALLDTLKGLQSDMVQCMAGETSPASPIPTVPKEPSAQCVAMGISSFIPQAATPTTALPKPSCAVSHLPTPPAATLYAALETSSAISQAPAPTTALPKPSAAIPCPLPAPSAAALAPRRTLASADLELCLVVSTVLLSQWLSGSLGQAAPCQPPTPRAAWGRRGPLCSADLELRVDGEGAACSWLGAPLDEAFLVAAC